MATLEQVAAQFYSIEQVADLLHVTPRVVRRLIKDGRLPAVTLTARNTRIPAAAVFALSAPSSVPDIR